MTNASHDARALLGQALMDCADLFGDRCLYTTALAAIEAALAQVEAVKEACAIAARNALVAYEWPPQDGDAQVDAVLAAIRALDVAAPQPPGRGDGDGR